MPFSREKETETERGSASEADDPTLGIARRTHQDEVDDGEDGRPETGVDREDDESEDHLPGAAM